MLKLIVKNLASGSSTGYNILCFIVRYPLWGVEPMPELVSVGDEKSGSEEAYTDPNQTFLWVLSVKQVV